MSNKKQPIVPVMPRFRFFDEINDCWHNSYNWPNYLFKFFECIDGLDGYLQMSLDGKEWHSMEEVREALQVWKNWKKNVDTIKEVYEQRK